MYRSYISSLLVARTERSNQDLKWLGSRNSYSEPMPRTWKWKQVLHLYHQTQVHFGCRKLAEYDKRNERQCIITLMTSLINSKYIQGKLTNRIRQSYKIYSEENKWSVGWSSGFWAWLVPQVVWISPAKWSSRNKYHDNVPWVAEDILHKSALKQGPKYLVNNEQILNWDSELRLDLDLPQYPPQTIWEGKRKTEMPLTISVNVWPCSWSGWHIFSFRQLAIDRVWVTCKIAWSLLTTTKRTTQGAAPENSETEKLHKFS